MFTHNSVNTSGCLAMALERLRPSMTSLRNWALTACEIPFEAIWLMLFKAMVSGMPALSRLVSCWV